MLISHRRQIAHLPPNENVACYFAHAGYVTAEEIMAAVEGKPDDDYVRVLGWDDEPEICICPLAALPKFFAG